VGSYAALTTATTRVITTSAQVAGHTVWWAGSYQVTRRRSWWGQQLSGTNALVPCRHARSRVSRADCLPICGAAACVILRVPGELLGLVFFRLLCGQ
jgi:hypothetical protein